MSMKNLHQGRYQLKNPEKYEGDTSNIIFRSSWEKRLMVFFDQHPSILSWGSEELVVPYFWEADQKYHRYFPDFMVTMMTPKGKVRVMIEVKPHSQTQEPKKTKGKREKTFINEVLTYTKNQAKWKAAEEYCLDRGWHFRIITEKEIFKNEKAW
nr:MAG TPA: head completion protein [Caudoviricetes sp.]